MLQKGIDEATTSGVNRFGLLICDVDDFASVNEALGTAR